MAKKTKKAKGKSVKAKAKKKKAVKVKSKKTAAKKKSAKKKTAPKKVKAKKKVAKKAVKKTAKKKTVKKIAKKKSAPKKAAPAVKKAVVNKPAEVKTVIEAGIATSVSGNGVSVSENTSSGETFKKHVTRLKPGDQAPFFEGLDQNGNRVTTLDFPGKTIILFFYPEDDTETCTIEACNLRDEYKYLGDSNYAVVGVSPDSVDSHRRFAEKYNLPYPLIADPDKKIINDFDVWGPKQLFGRIYDGLLRTTFIIGNEGIIRSVITDVKAANHARQITEA